MSAESAVIILTFNSAAVIGRTVAAALKVSPRIICVDSGSSDGTPEILRRLGCEVHSRAFLHYADQRNWAIRTLGDQFAWQLHLDSDEVLDDEAIASLRAALEDPREYAGFLLHRRTYFLGRELRLGGASNWHLRLFRSGWARCEDRLYDQHFICTGATRRLSGWMHDLNAGSLTEWTARHNRWSDLEARELLRVADSTEMLPSRLGREPRMRRRAYKRLYYRAPPFVRAWAYFLFRYVGQLGFLDGAAGFQYAFFQALWFRMLVDAKVYEARSAPEPGHSPSADAASRSAR